MRCKMFEKLGLALLAMSLVACSVQSLADVKAESKSKMTFKGTLGAVMGLMGKGGEVPSTTYVKGDFMRTDSGDEATIIDLAGERIITINQKKKTYNVVTFADLRRQFEEAQKEAKEEIEEEEEKPEAEEGAEWEVNVEVKDTGESKTINGFPSRQVILTLTVKPKGKDIEEAGGMEIKSDIWLTDKIEGYKQIEDFNRRYLEKLGEEVSQVVDKKALLAAIASDPRISKGFEKLRQESEKLQGTPVLTVTTFDVIKSKEEMEAEKEKGVVKPEDVGKRLFSKLIKKAVKKKEKSNRSTILEFTNELVDVSTASLENKLFEVPTDYKQVE